MNKSQMNLAIKSTHPQSVLNMQSASSKLCICFIKTVQEQRRHMTDADGSSYTTFGNPSLTRSAVKLNSLSAVRRSCKGCLRTRLGQYESPAHHLRGLFSFKWKGLLPPVDIKLRRS